MKLKLEIPGMTGQEIKDMQTIHDNMWLNKYTKEEEPDYWAIYKELKAKYRIYRRGICPQCKHSPMCTYKRIVYACAGMKSPEPQIPYKWQG